MDKWLQPWAGLGSCHPQVWVGPSERARLTSGHLPGFPRGSLILPRGQGPWLGRAGSGMSPRLPEESCSPCPASRRFPPGAPARPLWALDPRAGAAPAAPRVGPARQPGQPARRPRWRVRGDVGLSPAGQGGPPVAPVPPAPSRRAGWGSRPPPHQGPCRRGVRHRKGRERARKGTGGFSRERGCTRGGRAVPTCAPGQAPAARRADQSPVWRTHRQPSSFPPDLPKTSFAAAAKPSRARAPQGSPGPARAPGELRSQRESRSRQLPGLFLSNCGSSD